MTTKVVGARLGAGVLATSMALSFGMVSASSAAETAEAEAQAAQMNKENDVPGLRVGVEGGEAGTRLFGLTADDGSSLRAYCVEYNTPANDGTEMDEVPWGEYPDPESPFHENADKIHWIMQNSYPKNDLAAIEAAVGGTFTGGLSQEEAIGATQAAIWSFSDEVPLDHGNATPENPASAGDVIALYDYLTGAANVGIGDQPAPELSLTPAHLSGEAGEAIGPFEVSTNAETVDITSELPEGVELVDGEGAPLGDTVANGTQFSVDVPDDAEPGEGTVQLGAVTKLNVGRLFISSMYHEGKPSQSMILADSDEQALTVEGTVDWEAQPQPTETPTPTPTETPSETPTPTPTETPSETPTPTPTESPSETPTPTPTPTLPDTGTGAGTPALLAAALAAVVGGALLVRRRLTA